ncbi:nuclear transport factor 2 family protein [uncultured Hyphomicrobium sp.]|uniref:nuclear transport factor 2 family protein n=1 Tax=uncultured Hyphomicrobium sp. TaxID=194373 RepID=UPI0025D2FB34|nr:nuclear transport factor 2 family protein [uncultured Hyphomicrobium sp.]
MLTRTRARELIEGSHEAWRRGDLEWLLAQYADDMEYWCNAGDPSGGPVEIKGKAAFGETLAAVLRTTHCISHILSFDFDGVRGRTKAHYRLERRGTPVVLEGKYRQVISYKAGLISRLEEYHDAGRLTAFWQLTSGDAQPKLAVWDAERPGGKPPRS